MTSIPTALRWHPAARHSLVATSVAGLAAVVGVVALAAADTPSSAPRGWAHAPPPSAPTAAAIVGAGGASAADGDGERGGEPDGEGGRAALGSSGLPRTSGTTSAVSSARPRWQWPLEPRPPVVRPFRAPLTTYGRGHRGLDLGAPQGAQVRAVEGGVVTHAGVVGGRGTVTVTHADGVRSTYEPLRPSVARGSRVVTGDVLGSLEAGSGHCGARGCLHLGARRFGAYLDPLPLLVAGRLALLPVHRVG